MENYFTLHNGVKIPAIGFGTYKTVQAEGTGPIEAAIKAGYRHFDTAAVYQTEHALGEAVRKSGIPRASFFITTKLWKADMGYEGTFRAAEASLKELQMDYIDLYLIHWPRPDLSMPDWRELDAETWRAMEELYKKGVFRAIGLSNFLVSHLENIKRNCSILPMADQIEFHPGYLQRETVDYCKANGILPEAWSPFGRGRMLSHPVLCKIAARYSVSVAQLCTRFALQKGVLPLPKSIREERIRENMDVFSFEISDTDMLEIASLPPCGWSGEHPDRERTGAQYW